MIKKLTQKELLARDAKRDVWQEALDAMRDIKAGRIGRKYQVKVSSIVEARFKVGFTQARFANLLGVSKRTLQDWEQGRRNPTGAAKTLIAVAAKRPDVLRDLAA